MHSFLGYLFWSDVFIIGHNLKYDLEILDLFRKSSNIHRNIDWKNIDNEDKKNNSKWEDDFWQMSFQM